MEGVDVLTERGTLNANSYRSIIHEIFFLITFDDMVCCEEHI